MKQGGRQDREATSRRNTKEEEEKATKAENVGDGEAKEGENGADQRPNPEAGKRPEAGKPLRHYTESHDMAATPFQHGSHGVQTGGDQGSRESSLSYSLFQHASHTR